MIKILTALLCLPFLILIFINSVIGYPFMEGGYPIAFGLFVCGFFGGVQHLGLWIGRAFSKE